LLGAQVEGSQRLRCMLSQRADEPAVVVVRDLAGAMVELELLERGKRAVPFFCEAQAALLELVRRRQPVVAGGGLAQEGQSDKYDARDREHRADDERSGQMRTALSA
jgi:hypothetical protein